MTPVQNIDALTLKSWLEKGEAVLVDVREPDEFARGHIPRATSVPLAQVKEAIPALASTPQTKLVFQCQKGGRSGQACTLAGERLVYNLEGGISAWEAAGLPIESSVSSRATRLPLMHQVQIAVGALILLSVALGFSGIPAGFMLAGFFGAGLLFAGISGWCGMALLLAKMPWNR